MFSLVVRILSGIGIFIFALYLLNEGLTTGSVRLPANIEKRINSPLICFASGLGLAMLTQSSSAINSILVQLSHKEIIKEKSAYFVVMGTNIGTTIAAYIAFFSKIGVTDIFICLIFISSIFLLSVKRKSIKTICFFVSVFSMLFIGLKTISDSVPYLAAKLDVSNFAPCNNFLLLIISILLTAICQSSSLISVIIVALTGMGALEISSALFMIIGANVGTCSTALLVSIGKSKRGLNVALFNLAFNIIGLLIQIFAYYTHMLDWLIGLSVANGTKIALYHTFFNVTATLFTLPLLSWLAEVFNRKNTHLKLKSKST